MKLLIILLLLINISLAIDKNEILGTWYIKPDKNLATTFMQSAGNRFIVTFEKNNILYKDRKKDFLFKWNFINKNKIEITKYTSKSNKGMLDIISNFKNEIIMKSINTDYLKIIEKSKIKNCYNVEITNSKIKSKMCKIK